MIFRQPVVRVLCVGGLALVLSACKPAASAGETKDQIATRFAGQEKGGETYPQYDTRRDSYAGARGTFADQGCTEDCSGHQAGYDWAEEKGITDPDNCGGNSWSFIEGCQAYAEEHADEDEDKDEDDEDAS